MATERLSNVSLGLAVLLSFVVVALCVSYFAMMSTGRPDVATERDPSSRQAAHGNPMLNGS